jgi:tetratricopeptide (TPR) repeat protein
MARRRKKEEQEETILNIVEAREQAQSFFERNQNIILGVVGGLALIVGGYFAYKYLYLQPKQEEAIEQMYQAQIAFERDSFAMALNNPGGGYLGFLDVIDQYGGTKAANISKYYAGVSYLNLGRYEDAIDYLGKFKPAGDILPSMKFGALGDAHSEIGDFDKAISFYKKAVNAEDNAFITPYYLKKLALLSSRQGDTEAALKHFKEILDKYPNSVEALEAPRYISKYERQG